MKKTNLKAMAIVIALTVFACKNTNQDNNDYTDKVTAQDQIKRGQYLVNTLGCNDCHSPKIMTDRGPMPDPKRLLSGHNSNEVLPAYDAETAKGYVLFNMNSTAVIGPWGTSYAANLTPDATGIGAWSEEQFLKAMKEGKYKGLDGSRQLLPPMPWPAYSHMPDEDLKAIFAYLKSLKPVDNLVPQATPPSM